MNLDNINSSQLKKSQIVSSYIKSNNFRKEVNVDNRLLELFFSNDDSLYTQGHEKINFDKHQQVKEIQYIINNMLPEIEKHVIQLIFFFGKKQEAVGKTLNISQEMVCYYKKRGLSRISLHYFLRSIDIDDMETFFTTHLTKKQRIAMIEYFKEHDLRRIVKRISDAEHRTRILNYIAIGSRIKLGIKRLAFLKENEDLEIKKKAELYHKIFTILKRHNSLYHTQSKKVINQELIA